MEKNMEKQLTDNFSGELKLNRVLDFSFTPLFKNKLSVLIESIGLFLLGLLFLGSILVFENMCPPHSPAEQVSFENSIKVSFQFPRNGLIATGSEFTSIPLDSTKPVQTKLHVASHKPWQLFMRITPGKTISAKDLQLYVRGNPLELDLSDYELVASGFAQEDVEIGVQIRENAMERIRALRSGGNINVDVYAVGVI